MFRKILILLLMVTIVLVLPACVPFQQAATPQAAPSATNTPATTLAPEEIQPTATEEPPVQQTPLSLHSDTIAMLSPLKQMPLESPMRAGWLEDGQGVLIQTQQEVVLYSVDEFQQISQLSLDESAFFYALTPIGDKAAISFDMMTLEIYSLSSNLRVQTITPQIPIQSAHFSPDGERILVTSFDEIIAIEFLVDTGEEVGRFTGFEFAGPVYDAFYSRHTDDIIWVSRGDAAVQKRSTGEMTGIFSHEDFVNSIVIHPSRETMVVSTAGTVGGDFLPVIQVWDLNSQQLLGSITTQGLIKDLVFNADGTLLIGADQASLCFWDLAEMSQLAALDQHTDTISFVSLSPDGAAIVTGSFDNSIVYWSFPP